MKGQVLPRPAGPKARVWHIWLARGMIALALLLAFAAYQDPTLMLQLGNQLLSCF